jgi:hypothetical protein
MAFTFHADAGHGWLEVTDFDLIALGLKPSDFSKYSYVAHPRYFLEEDCDANKFFTAYVKRHGVLPVIHDEYQHNSFVRSLRRIAA